MNKWSQCQWNNKRVGLLLQVRHVQIRLWQRNFQYPARLAKSAIFNLSDEPTSRSTWSAASGRIPCPRTNSKLWSPSRGRYLLAAELLLAFGVPATWDTSDFARVRQFMPPAGMDFAKVVGCLVAVQSRLMVLLKLIFKVLMLTKTSCVLVF